ncbi:MAG: DNA cytosine methyltransferase [Actinomycetota bacterium]
MKYTRAANADLRQAARNLGRRVARSLDSHWTAGREGEGPIDVVDLFSGCGGMSAGFQAINGAVPAYRLLLAVDIDEVANATYERNLGMAPIAADVNEYADDPSQLRSVLRSRGRRRSRPLVMIGCAPCQGFSSHRNGEGTGDSRNSLFGSFAQVAAALKPDAVVVENVPELFTERYWPHVEFARSVLMDAGYRVHLSIHNMAEFGVPQERFRALMLAMRRPVAQFGGHLSRDRFRTTRDAIAALPEISAGEHHRDDPMHYTAHHRESTLETIRAVPKDGGNRPADVGPACLRRVEKRQGKPAYEDVYGRLRWDRPAVTITNYARNPASGRYVHPEQDRGLSVREGALLQSFPAEYHFEGGLDPSFRQIGNAVPPVFAAQLAAYVLGEVLAVEEPTDVLPEGLREPVGVSFSRLIPALKSGSRLLA